MPYDVDIGDGADALGQNQLTDALDGTYWASGWDATLGTGDLEVDIAAGSGAVDGTDVSTGSTQTIDFTGGPDSTDPRKAVIYVDSGGTVQKALGTPQPVDPSGEIRFRTYNPSPPASVSGVVVAEVWLAAGETVLESADVRDRRVANQAAEAAGPNLPDYVEDPNSPHNFATDGQTFTLADSYDHILIFAKPIGATTQNIQLQLNGDTGSNYVNYDITRTSTTEDRIPLDEQQRQYLKIEISGRWNTSAWYELKNESQSSAELGFNTAITSPLTDITLTVAEEVVINVYGKNVNE
jgi:hypothetical protein